MPPLRFKAKAPALGETSKRSASGRASVESGERELTCGRRLSSTTPLTSSVTLSSADTLKIVLTTTEGRTAKKPHQAFLTLHEPTTGLEESFAFSIKENGKGKVELVSRDNECGRILEGANKCSLDPERSSIPVSCKLEACPSLDPHRFLRFFDASEPAYLQPRCRQRC